MRLRFLRHAIAWSLALLLLAPAIAVAVTVYPTSITVDRSPSGGVEPGTSVHIYGRLRSPKPACYRSSTIKLVKVGTGTIRTTTTGRRGGYSFDIRVRSTARYRVVFPGKDLDVVHPSTEVCASSREGFRILVR